LYIGMVVSDVFPSLYGELLFKLKVELFAHTVEANKLRDHFISYPKCTYLSVIINFYYWIIV